MLLLRTVVLFGVLDRIYSIPIRGSHPWSILLCKYRDVDREPRPPEYFHSWILDPNIDVSIRNFFLKVSNNLYSIDGSVVSPWLTLPLTKAAIAEAAEQDQALAHKYDDADQRVFAKTKQICKQVAFQQNVRLFRNVVVIMNDEQTAIFCSGTGVLITPAFFLSAALSHEMTHSFHIGHSFSDRPTKIYPYAEPGEYDDKYDLMSTAHAHMFFTIFGYFGPGLNGPHLDYLGWLPAYRVFFFGRDGNLDTDIRLSSTSIPHNQGTDWVLILVPFDRDDPQNVFALELRTRTGVDGGIRKPGAVVIHKVVRQDTSGFYFSYIQTKFRQAPGNKPSDDDYDWLEGDEFLVTGLNSASPDDFIRIRIVRIDASSGMAVVHINTTFKPRSADFYDRHTYGMNTCKDGFAWRLLDPYDYTCIPSAKVAVYRSQTAANQRDRCPVGNVFREAFDGDTVCVTPEDRADVAEDNRLGAKSLKHRKFFNGFDVVDD